MTNFVTLAYLDVFDLAASLRTRWGQFRRQEDGRLLLPIRGEPPNGDPEDESKFGWYRQSGVRSGKWPELKALLDRVEREGGIEFGRIRVEMMQPGYLGSFEIDHSGYAGRIGRTILALRWNPQALLYCGGEVNCPQPGMVTLISHRLPCTGINMGEWGAIALVVDSRKKEKADEC